VDAGRKGQLVGRGFQIRAGDATRLRNAYQFVNGSAGAPATYEALVSNPNLLPEQMEAYELGVPDRADPADPLDISCFFNHYDQLGCKISTIDIVPSPVGNAVLDDEGTFVTFRPGHLGRGMSREGERGHNSEA